MQVAAAALLFYLSSDKLLVFRIITKAWHGILFSDPYRGLPGDVGFALRLIPAFLFLLIKDFIAFCDKFF